MINWSELNKKTLSFVKPRPFIIIKKFKNTYKKTSKNFLETKSLKKFQITITKISSKSNLNKVLEATNTFCQKRPEHIIFIQKAKNPLKYFQNTFAK